VSRARRPASACCSLLREQGEAPRLGVLLVERKVLTSANVRAILRAQARRGVGPLVEVGLKNESPRG